MRAPRILHVDDDTDILEVANLALELVGGLTVAQSASGAEALRQAPGFLPDVFLLDYMMPGMTGAELLAELRKIPLFKATPAIFLTAVDDGEVIQRLREAGAVEIIPKPFDAMTLASQVTAIWKDVAQLAS
nr:response regulator [Solirhodobacter olei]